MNDHSCPSVCLSVCLSVCSCWGDIVRCEKQTKTDTYSVRGPCAVNWVHVRCTAHAPKGFIGLLHRNKSIYEKNFFFLVRCTSDRVRCAVFFSSQSFICLCLSIFKSIRELTPSVGLVWLTSVFFDVWFRFLVTTLVNDQWKALYESRVWSVPCAFLGAK